MQKCFLFASLVSVCALAAVPCRAQKALIVNTPTFADFLGANGVNSLDFRIGAYGQGYIAGGGWTGTQVPIITGPTGFASQAVNYPNGVYTLQFNAPNPAAVGVSVGGDMSGLGNVQISGNSYQATLNLFHDGGNIKAGLGEIDINTTGSNPVTNWRVIAPGGLSNPGGFTAQASATLNRFQGFRGMNDSNINNNVALLTSADLLPSGQSLGTFGSSLVDQLARAKANPNSKYLYVNVPFNAAPSYVTAAATLVKAANLPGNIQVMWERGNEPWNFAFSHAGWLYQQAQADPRVPAGDAYTSVGREYGLKAAEMMIAVQSVIPAARGFLNSQGANQYFVDQAKSSVAAVYGSGAVQQYFKWQGISFYPNDNLTTDPHTPQGIHDAILSDIPRQANYLALDIADAHASGLKEFLYEVSANGLLTQSGVNAAEMDAFLASPLSGDATNATLNAIFSQDIAGAAWFTEPGGDYWGGTPDPFAPITQEQVQLFKFADALTGGIVPEPSIGLAAALLGMMILMRRSTASRAGRKLLG